MERYLKPQIVHDLDRKMVFLGGPRQVGKTTLAKQVLGRKQGYLNWDAPEHREAILKREYPPVSTLVFDEIHKYRDWRNYLKGLYDLRKNDLHILVTGSARLDSSRFSGDSLQGRYHYLRLHPLSAAELGIKSPDELKALLTLGGFPEPFLEGSEVEAKRWSRDYRSRLLDEDVSSLEQIQDLGTLELMLLRLPDLVGSPLSINALRENLQISHKAASRWLDALERFYAIFRLAPFGAPRIRAVKKERKHYHFDWSLVTNMPVRFENMAAAHLLKWVHYEEDSKGRDIELRYFRDVDGREVDFVVVEEGRPVMLVECKWKEKPAGQGLRYLKKRFPSADAWQIYVEGEKDVVTDEGIRIAPALTFFSGLV